jgi:hypothetical protein
LTPDFNEARQFCRFDRFFEAGADWSISRMVDSSSELVGDVGGNGDVAGESEEGLDLLK